MLLNPMAAKRLNTITRIGYYPYTTHHQRNEAIRVFLEEAGGLLDQQAEGKIKHAIELYTTNEIPYEHYLELIERVSNEEAVRGAAYGGEYARNRVFDFAQTILDQAKERAHQLALVEAKKQYEVEKQKTEQNIKEIMQQYTATLETIVQHYDGNLKMLIQQLKDELVHQQETTIEQTRATSEHVITKHLQDEKDRLEREIREQELLRPARAAAHAAIERVASLEQKEKAHKQWKYGVRGLGMVGFVVLVIALFFISLPQWLLSMLLMVIASLILVSVLWKSPIPEGDIAEGKRQIKLFQTKSGEYAPLSEEERCALLVQKIR